MKGKDLECIKNSLIQDADSWNSNFEKGVISMTSTMELAMVVNQGFYDIMMGYGIPTLS
jgi:hypothetical protein